VNTDLVLWLAATLLGTCIGLLHVSLTIRALRRSLLGAALSLLVPLGAPVFAYRTGARKIAVVYVVFVAGYVALIAASQ
jgi:hypothetical protein